MRCPRLNAYFKAVKSVIYYGADGRVSDEQKVKIMYAVIRTGGKQYRVAPEDVLDIEKIAGETGDIVEFGDVLLIGGDGEPKLGAPLVDGAKVAAEVVEQRRGEKILVFKKKRRSTYRRKNGHRQSLTTIRVTEILTDGAKPKKAASAKSSTKKDA